MATDKPLPVDLGAKPIKIRKGIASDAPFIFSSWLKSMRSGPFARDITNSVYFAESHKVIERLLKTCEVHVACDAAQEADIYGYICGERIDGIFILHFIYVKHMYRNLGIGTQLLNSFAHDSGAPSMYTHHNETAKALAAKYRMIYSPYIALTPDYRDRVELSPVNPKELLIKVIVVVDIH